MVTGGSSGIGSELVNKLARDQELNVVIVALDDNLLKDKIKQLEKDFPKRKFIAVGADLTKPNEYVPKLLEATKDLDIGAVFNNAGFLRIGSFTGIPLERHMEHLECNVGSYLRISHIFYSKWREAGRKGLITFTCSSSAFFPAPYSCMYGATKAFLDEFTRSLTVEGLHHGVDILTYHPQYTRTRLYDTTMKMGVFDLLDRVGSSSEEVAEQLLRSIGRLYVRDQGWYSLLMRIVGGILFGANWLLPIMAFGLKLAPEYKKMK